MGAKGRSFGPCAAACNKRVSPPVDPSCSLWRTRLVDDLDSGHVEIIAGDGSIIAERITDAKRSIAASTDGTR